MIERPIRYAIENEEGEVFGDYPTRHFAAGIAACVEREHGGSFKTIWHRAALCPSCGDTMERSVVNRQSGKYEWWGCVDCDVAIDADGISSSRDRDKPIT